MMLEANLLAKVRATPNMGIAALLSFMAAILPICEPDTSLEERCVSSVAL